MEKREAGRLLCDFLSGRKIPEARLEKLTPADWENLVDWALRFKVGGLLYREAKSRNFPDECFAGNPRNRLRGAYRNLATKNTNLFNHASEVLTSLADNQLPVIALKGLALAESIYGDIAVRPMSDLDLLVKEKDLIRAGRILLTMGYKQRFPAWESMAKTFHHLPHFSNKSGVIIELHWNIVPPDSFIKMDLDGFWERARLIKVNNIEVRVFSPEDLFLHLCIHACLHLRTGLGLIPICDIAGLIKTAADGIDWQIVIERATRWGGEKCVYLMLLLVRELLGVAPPDKIISGLRPDDYQIAFFNEALEQIFDVKSSDQLIRSRSRKLSKLKKVKGMKSKLYAVLKEAFPSKVYLAHAYPVAVSSPKMYLCYLFRLGRLSGYYSVMLFRFFLHDRSVREAVDQERRASAVLGWLFSK